MRVKRTLSLVNSVWNRAMRQFLYEFVWITRARQACALALALKTDACKDLPEIRRLSGNWIARLRVETGALDRCEPADVQTILHFAHHLEEFTDHMSVRRSRFGGFGAGATHDPPADPRALCTLLARDTNAAPLRRLAWTTYDDTPFDVQLAPVLAPSTAAHLEYLELTTFTTDPPVGLGLPADLDGAGGVKPAPASAGAALPRLRALRLSLADAPFAILSTWALPALRNLSVVLADASPARAGFAAFFVAHGAALKQLELAHAPAATSLVVASEQADEARRRVRGKLAAWCPNLEELVCSADRAWDWQAPDWIAPHELMPAHPNLRIIGVRDVDLRLEQVYASLSDSDPSPFVPIGSTGSEGEGGGQGHGAEAEAGEGAWENDFAPLHPLLEQLTALLSVERFPSLRFVRDLSPESDAARKVRPRRAVFELWMRYLRRCAERGVYLENWRAESVRVRDLRRASGRWAAEEVG
jgi:hypothetical protein